MKFHDYQKLLLGTFSIWGLLPTKMKIFNNQGKNILQNQGIYLIKIMGCTKSNIPIQTYVLREFSRYFKFGLRNVLHYGVKTLNKQTPKSSPLQAPQNDQTKQHSSFPPLEWYWKIFTNEKAAFLSSSLTLWEVKIFNNKQCDSQMCRILPPGKWTNLWRLTMYHFFEVRLWIFHPKLTPQVNIFHLLSFVLYCGLAVVQTRIIRCSSDVHDTKYKTVTREHFLQVSIFTWTI